MLRLGSMRPFYRGIRLRPRSFYLDARRRSPPARDLVSVLRGGICLEARLEALDASNLAAPIEPLDLKDALVSASAYAENTYRWAETGAIRVIDP